MKINPLVIFFVILFILFGGKFYTIKKFFSMKNTFLFNEGNELKQKDLGIDTILNIILPFDIIQMVYIFVSFYIYIKYFFNSTIEEILDLEEKKKQN